MNQYDVGMTQDFDNMTHELGEQITLVARNAIESYDGSEGIYTDPILFGTIGIGFPILFSRSASDGSFTEIAFVQPLKAEHEMVKSGQLDIGDIRCFFKSDTKVSEDYFIIHNDGWFKLLELKIVRGMSNDSIIYVRAFGKKVAGR